MIVFPDLHPEHRVSANQGFKAEITATFLFEYR